MAKINLYPCMIFDAICYLEQRTGRNEKMFLKEQADFIKKIKDLTTGKIDDDCVGMSNLCLILSIYTNNINIQNYTLDDLINVFNNIHDVSKVVRERTTNEYWKSFLFPTLDYLIDSYAKKYADDIIVLKEIGFDKLWESNLYPYIDEEIKACNEHLQNLNIDELFANIKKMKNIDYISDCDIYISFMSRPVSFTLYNNCFLTHTGRKQINLELIAHELMHGFASDELINEYLKYVAKDEFLTEQNNKLNEYSGNEEEFVMAAGYYLSYLSKMHAKDKYTNYGNCPLAVIIFDMLIKEENVPVDYNDWLIKQFKNGRFPEKNIKEYIYSGVIKNR